MIGKFSLYEYINETINLDKEHRLMLSKALQLIALENRINAENS